ncbi:hypothetical protein GCM10022291_10480 [Postechiella marina]|uniref:LTD domain-containing protein n=1 Tax=Postechiella marina TaxID=943941 RepID=A0ABP8C4C5_9FLAO
MKKISLLIITLLSVGFGYAQMNDLIISEYGEGDGNNKYVEIFNGTGADVDLSDYEIWRISNGGSWSEVEISLTGVILVNGATYVVAHTGADAVILAVASGSTGKVSGSANWNGNDAVGLAKDDGTGTFVLIDAVGTDGVSPPLNEGWDVAGVPDATYNRTLVRKASVCNTNTNWTTSAGTNVVDSEWIVLTQDDWSDIGSHTTDCCIYATTWSSGAWSSGPPTLNTIVTIDDNFNTSSGGLQTNFSACTLIVNAGATLTVGNGNFVEVQNSVTVNGNLFVETQGNFVQNDDSGTFTVGASGTARVNKQTASKSNWYYYTYWSSPVVGETIGSVFANVDADRRFSFNAANFVDTDNDDIDDNADAWTIENAGALMVPGVGYAATESQFFMGGSGTAAFEGAFNTGNVDVTIDLNVANAGLNWNFIGNPYPSALDFIAFQAANASILDGVAYFWAQASPPEAVNDGNEVLNFNLNDYAVFTVGTGGTAGGSGPAPSGFVGSGQGFFIPALNSGVATFTNAMRMADVTSNSQFFKSGNTKKSVEDKSLENKLWVNLTSDNGVFNQILVGYVNGATNSNDGMSYDAPKLITQDFAAALYSKMEGDDTHYTIQGKDLNSINLNEVIKVGFASNIEVATLFKLSIDHLQGDFLTSNSVYLKDNLLNKTHNLSEGDYTFTSEVGEFNERFEIVFNTDNTLSTNQEEINTNKFTIVDVDDNKVQFNTNSNLDIKSISVFDLLGRQLYNLKGENTSETYTLSNLKNTVYIAKIELSNGVVITKKAIKK